MHVSGLPDAPAGQPLRRPGVMLQLGASMRSASRLLSWAARLIRSEATRHPFQYLGQQLIDRLRGTVSGPSRESKNARKVPAGRIHHLPQVIGATTRERCAAGSSGTAEELIPNPGAVTRFSSGQPTVLQFFSRLPDPGVAPDSPATDHREASCYIACRSYKVSSPSKCPLP